MSLVIRCVAEKIQTNSGNKTGTDLEAPISTLNADSWQL